MTEQEQIERDLLNTKLKVIDLLELQEELRRELKLIGKPKLQLIEGEL